MLWYADMPKEMQQTLPDIEELKKLMDDEGATMEL